MTGHEINVEIEGEQVYKQARIELETDGTYWGSTLKINGEAIHNCSAIEIKIGPETQVAEVTVHLNDVPLKFVGQLSQEADDSPPLRTYEELGMKPGGRP